MAAGGKREYTAVFSIGAQLLGTFSGAMNAAQARLKGLQRAAQRVQESVKRMTSVFSGLFAGLAAFGAAAIFRKIFEGASDAAIAAEQRTRKMTTSLLQLDAIRKKGLPYAKQQVEEIRAANELLAKQQVYGVEMLDTAAANLAVAAIPPKYIKQALPYMADMLATMQGVTATQEDMGRFANAFGRAVKTGMAKPLKEFGIIITKPEQKMLTAKAKVGDFMAVYNFLIKKMKFAHGAAAELMKTPQGRIKLLNNEMDEMAKRLGSAMLPAKARMADFWRGVLPDAEKALNKLGAAFTRSLGRLGFSTKSFSDVVKGFFGWIGDHADAIITTLETITALFVGLAAVATIYGYIEIVGIGLAIGLIVEATTKYKNFQDLLAKKPGTMADPEQFTKHWYLLGNTWTDVSVQWKLFTDDFVKGWEAIEKAVATVKAAIADFFKWVTGLKLPSWISQQLDKQAELLKKSDSYRIAQNEKDRELERQQRAAQPYHPKGAAGLINPPPAGFDATARFGPPVKLPQAPYFLRPPAPTAMAPWMEAEHNVMSAGQRAFDAWGLGAQRIKNDASATIPTALDVTGAAITNRVMRPIMDCISQWTQLSLLMGTPLSPAITAGARGVAPLAPAANSVNGLPAPDIPDDTTGLQAGGIVTKPMIAHIGEKGPEAVVPLSKLARLGSFAKRHLPAWASEYVDALPQGFADFQKTPTHLPFSEYSHERPTMLHGLLNVSEKLMDRGGERTPTTLHFSPSITIHGNADDQTQRALIEKLSDLSRNFIEDFKQAQNQERRLSYEGGYG